MNAKMIILALADYYGISFNEMDAALEEAIKAMKRRP